MTRPHYQPPPRPLTCELGFWVCVLQTIWGFCLTSGEDERSMQDFYVAVGCFGVALAGALWGAYSPQARRGLRVGMGVVCFALVLACGGDCLLSMRLRVWASRPALESLAQSVKQGRTPRLPVRAGLYKVISVDENSLVFSETCFPLEGESTLFWGGEPHFQYASPDAEYKPLVGSWGVVLDD